MSLQLLAAAAMAGVAALWFLWGIIQDFKEKDGCASGCGTCSKRCPFQAAKLPIAPRNVPPR